MAFNIKQKHYNFYCPILLLNLFFFFLTILIYFHMFNISLIYEEESISFFVVVRGILTSIFCNSSG